MRKQHEGDVCSDLVIAQALAALIYAPGWPETYRVLKERQKVLLLDRALDLLTFTSTQLYLQGEIEDAKNWEQYVSLLEDARRFGILSAWENFMQRHSNDPGDTE